MKYEYFANENLYARVEREGEELGEVLERINRSSIGEKIATM